MQIVIDIDENLYTRLFDNGVEFNTDDKYDLERSVRHGKVLLKTHEDEIAKMRAMVKQKNCAPCCYYNNCMCKKKCRRVTDMEDCEYWW